jgi:hypothetical protein
MTIRLPLWNVPLVDRRDDAPARPLTGRRAQRAACDSTCKFHPGDRYFQGVRSPRGSGKSVKRALEQLRTQGLFLDVRTDDAARRARNAWKRKRRAWRV